MNRLFILLTTTMFVLAACSNGPATTTEDKRGNTEPQVETEAQISGNDEELISLNQLVLGTMQLEDTEFAINVEQASKLLTLWKAYRSLIESDIAAQVELQALLGQIEAAMTNDQLEAIRTIEISQEEIDALVEDLDLQPEDRPDGVGEGIFPGGAEGGRSGGRPGAGAGGGPGAGFEGEISPDQLATAQAQREESGGTATRMGSFLIAPLIELLESIMAG